MITTELGVQKTPDPKSDQLPSTSSLEEYGAIKKYHRLFEYQSADSRLPSASLPSPTSRDLQQLEPSTAIPILEPTQPTLRK